MQDMPRIKGITGCQLVPTFITVTCFRNTSLLTVQKSFDVSLYRKSTMILNYWFNSPLLDKTT